MKNVSSTIDCSRHWTNSLRMEFCFLTAGSFYMGSPKTESRRFADETLHKVVLTNHFYLSAFLTTQAQWRAILGENPSKHSGCKDAPVECVNWYDCINYIERLNEEEYGAELRKYLGNEWRYSLPTEAQWEYACRAGSSSPYYVGETITLKDGNFGKTQVESSPTTQQRVTTIVGKYPPNQWGFYDMIGNVCEWTLDGYSDYVDSLSENPIGKAEHAERVARGGSWKSLPENCRSASRFNFLPTYKSDSCGFRVAIVRLE